LKKTLKSSLIEVIRERYFVAKKKKGQGQSIDYFLYGRITDLRTLTGDDIDFDPDEGKGEGGLVLMWYIRMILHLTVNEMRNRMRDPGGLVFVVSD